ncbi:MULTISPECIES: hypothetical protein [unclassified Streptomyces]|uniref:hypothetical protein n=1 Tax=unclassified Streptomyces TaxID=2593676 RepID=UPI00093AA274|nr:hypothetical protein [Streptomyces sp. TSRI0107]OKJ83949.1 hypothetical protein AMK31_17615 [Streptomyces sp. TSRI0107]
MERSALRKLAEDGLLLTSRALTAGWPRRSLTRALRAEGWAPLRHGVWLEPGRNPDHYTRLRATQLTEPRLVVSHLSAAALWHIETLTRADRHPLEFIDPGLTIRRTNPGIRVHRMPLAAAEVLNRQGLHVTSPARTLADLLRAGPRDQAVVAVDSALGYRRTGRARRAPLTDLPTITGALDRPLQGASRARDWLRLCDARAGSPAETIARLRMYDAGLHPVSQAELLTPSGCRVILDFLFRREGLAVEIEGYAYHGTRDSHRRDVIRFNQIVQCPEVRRLLRFTAEDVFHRPDDMLHEIRTALTADAAPKRGAAQTPSL